MIHLNKKGFTMIEILVVISIIGFLVSAGLYNFTKLSLRQDRQGVYMYF